MTDEAGGKQAKGETSARRTPDREADGSVRTGSRHRSSRSGRHWRHSRSGSIEKRRQRHRLIRQLLVVAVGVLGLASAALAALWWHDHAVLSDGREAERGQAARVEELCKAREEEIAALRAQLGDLAEGRLPRPLRALEIDKLIDLGEAGAAPKSGLRSIWFTRVGPKDNPAYEYRLTCHNGLDESIQPRYLILVFNQAGIQTGSGDVEKSQDWTHLATAGLAPGESCAFSGRIELQFGDTPAYFVVLDVPSGSKLPW